MTIIEKLEKAEGFTDTEKNLAAFILKNKESVIHISVQMLADEAYVSPGSVIKFCQKLGLRGFSDFKIQLAGELSRPPLTETDIKANFPLSENDSFTDIVNKQYSLSLAAIKDTYQKINAQEYRKALQLIMKARRVVLFASGDNYAYAEIFQNQLMKLDFPVILTHLPDEALQTSYLMKPEDCALFITFSGQTESLTALVKNLLRHSVPIVTITAVPDSYIGRHSTAVLQNTNLEEISSKITTFTSGTGTQLILHILYSYIFVNNYSRNIALRLDAAKGDLQHHQK